MATYKGRRSKRDGKHSLGRWRTGPKLTVDARYLGYDASTSSADRVGVFALISNRAAVLGDERALATARLEQVGSAIDAPPWARLYLGRALRERREPRSVELFRVANSAFDRDRDLEGSVMGPARLAYYFGHTDRYKEVSAELQLAGPVARQAERDDLLAETLAQRGSNSRDAGAVQRGGPYASLEHSGQPRQCSSRHDSRRVGTGSQRSSRNQRATSHRGAGARRNRAALPCSVARARRAWRSVRERTGAHALPDGARYVRPCSSPASAGELDDRRLGVTQCCSRTPLGGRAPDGGVTRGGSRRRRRFESGRILGGCASARWLSGNCDRAFSASLAALDRFEASRGDGNDAGLRVAVFAREARPFHAQAGQRLPAGSGKSTRADLELAFLTLEPMRVRALLVHLAAGQSKVETHTSAAAPPELSVLTGAIARVQRRLVESMLADTEHAAELTRLSVLELQKLELLAKQPGNRADVPPSIPSLVEIQSSLDNDEAMLAYPISHREEGGAGG